jgi:hypothetical protein
MDYVQVTNKLICGLIGGLIGSLLICPLPVLADHKQNYTSDAWLDAVNELKIGWREVRSYLCICHHLLESRLDDRWRQ